MSTHDFHHLQKAHTRRSHGQDSAPLAIALTAFEDVERRFDGNSYQTQAAAERAAKVVAEIHGYIALCYNVTYYDPDQVVRGELGPDATSDHELYVFEDQGAFDEWIERAGLSGGDGMFAPPDEYQNPVTGRIERIEAFVTHPTVPQHQRRATHYVDVDAIHVGSEVQHEGLWRIVDQVEIHDGHVTIGFEPSPDSDEEFASLGLGASLLVREQTMMSEDEFERSFTPTLADDGGYFDYEDVADTDVHHVWSVFDPGNGEEIAAPGLHRENVIGYVITDGPWRTGAPKGGLLLHR